MIEEEAAGPEQGDMLGLGVEARRLLGVLVGLGGVDAVTVPVQVLAAAADVSGARCTRHLQHLERCRLAESAVGGFRIPTELVGVFEPARIDADAWSRAGRWCLAALYRAARVLGSAALPGKAPTRVRGIPVPAFGHNAAVLEWYAGSYRMLTTVLRALSEAGCVEPVWRIALLMLQIDAVAGAGNAWRGVADLGLAAARRAGEAAGEAMIGEYTGKQLLASGQVDQARSQQEQVLSLRAMAGDEDGLVRSYNAIGLIESRAGDLAAAEPLFRKALRMAEQQQALEFAAYARMNLGALLARTGAHGEAEVLLAGAIGVLREGGRLHYEADATSALAGLYRRQSRLDLALTTALRAVEIAERAGLPLFLAAALTELAAVHQACDALVEALEVLREARLIYLAAGDELRAERLAEQIAAIADTLADR